MQGMTFLITQMLVCLIIAALIGVLIGWFLRGSKIAALNARIEALEADYYRAKDDYEGLNTRYRDDIDEKDREITEYRSNLTLLESKSAERDTEITRLNTEYTSRLSELEEEIDRTNYIREDLKVKDTTIERLESEVRRLNDVSAEIAKKANLSAEELHSIEGDSSSSHDKGGSWFDKLKNPISGHTLDSEVDDADTPSWATGLKSKLASGAAAAAAAAAARKQRSQDEASTEERVAKATAQRDEQAPNVGANADKTDKTTKADNTTQADSSAATPLKEEAKTASADRKPVSQDANDVKDTKTSDGRASEHESVVSRTSSEKEPSQDSSPLTKSEDAVAAESQGEKPAATKAMAKPAKKELTEAEHERVRQIRESRGVKIEAAIFEGVPDTEDDLKEIYGIGPVMEGILNDLGIYNYEQLAKLDNSQLQTLRDSIGSFHNRVDRDDWLSGARKCYKEKYGTELS